ncbi:hypothetical protein J056_003170 [Wallemia ichthyophaga EXF-994]|uniref:Calponin-homology (CH) domain-containing protein n=1 Tax=Wallemia ichthyophaga (strain EXF-994 / CBS 113033) TaxID=1299270 RepID=R9ANG6_WALI9|nr:uncharacterized protein J056_003170 [Wallemia ichthyophaga EXF-994]EOR03713.1 hypothetical protein J056_003170 [Wallemia ichthyophaga EXF-994]TIB30189.1 hypothetical protein E3P84_03444 [Wallemia ichthyophaga]TIB39705.1 hypothetical protein E3P83_03344 [Wallemia ichthyophaga]
MSIPFPTLNETEADSFTAFSASTLPAASAEPRRPLRSKNRPTAFYGSPNPRAPPQPFSRSAAKRESVMALGSIQHLQHLYAKNGLASKARPHNVTHASDVVLALGPSAAEEGMLEPPPRVQLPPSPDTPILETSSWNKPQSPDVAPQTDPELLKPAVERDITHIKKLWNLEPKESHPSVNILELLKSTISTIRSVQQYAMALPFDHVSTPTTSSQAAIGHRRLPTLRSISYNISTASRQFRPPNPRKTRASLGSTTQNDFLDPLALVRSSALEVLSALQDIEERCRVENTSTSTLTSPNHVNADNFIQSISDQSQLETLETAEYHQNENSFAQIPLIEHPIAETSLKTDATGNTTGAASIATHYTGSGKPVPVWQDYESPDINSLTNAEEAGDRPARERWEERLLNSNGYIYKDGVNIKLDFDKERKITAKYVALVEKMFLDTVKAKPRHSSPTILSSPIKTSDNHLGDALQDMAMCDYTNISQDGGDESHLPTWAQKKLYQSDPLGRLYALLVSFLPDSLNQLLPSPVKDPVAFMDRLSDGQMLCIVFNSVLRRSRRPWGFIPPQDIHDITGLEKEEGDETTKTSKSKTSWTFRRTDNLRIWAAALKLRYLISLSPSILPTIPHILTNKPPSLEEGDKDSSSPLIASLLGLTRSSFNAKAVAQRFEGWETSLGYATGRYVEAVVHEYRLQEGFN